MSEDEIHELLVKEKICWLATVSPNGQPHVIPINFGFSNGDVHIIFVSNKSKSVRNIGNNAKVCVGINVGEEQGKIKCVLIRGRAELTDDIKALKQAHLKILPKCLNSKKKAEDFLQKLVATDAITKRMLVIIKPKKILSWKL